MKKNKLQAQKAQPRIPPTVYLTLSSDKTQLEKRFYIADLFKKAGPDGLGTLNKKDVQQLWVVLHKAGFTLSPALEYQYRLMYVCLFCGEGLLGYTGLDKKNLEIRCPNCNYLYFESGNK